MSLGISSLSLAVKDLAASRAFYEALGFTVLGGMAEQGWLILGCGDTKVGLFQGMFERNMLTFNPGWGPNAEPLAAFTDVRQVQAHLQAQGIALQTSTDPDGTGPAHIVVIDPDGNPVMLDQHVPKPTS